MESLSYLSLPSREEFHREFAGIITSADFNTYYPNSNRNIAYTGLERHTHRIANKRQCVCHNDANRLHY